MEFYCLRDEDQDNPTHFYRSRTQKVLEKWGIEGEMNDYNVRTAASSYARIQIKYRMMKWITIGAVAFLAIFLGLMIGSVVLGIEATKEYKVKDQAIVSASKSSPLKTSEISYSTKVSLTTPLSVIQGIKSLRYDTTTKDGKKEYLEFQVVSFYFSEGRNLTLYGHTQMANVLKDGSVEVIPIKIVNGAKRFERTLAVRADDTTAQTTTEQPPVSSSPPFIPISSCAEFRNMSSTGKYVLTNDIDCGSTIYSPLAEFGGKLSGRMFTVTMNIDSQLKAAGVFSKLLDGAFIMNINFRGNITGSGICGGVAATSESGVILYTVNVYSRIVCFANLTSLNTQVFAGGLVGYLGANHQNLVLFYRCVSQARIRVGTPFPNSAYIGGIFALSSSTSLRVYLKTITAATVFENLLSSTVNTNTNRDETTGEYNANAFGFVSTVDLGEDLEGLAKRAITVQDDLNYICDPDYGTEEGYNWWLAWVDAYADLTSGTNPQLKDSDEALHDANVAMCVNFLYNNNTGYNIPLCCRDFGIVYDQKAACIEYYCPNVWAEKLSNPCYFCRDNFKRDSNSAQVSGGNIFYPDGSVPEFFYNEEQLTSQSD